MSVKGANQTLYVGQNGIRIEYGSILRKDIKISYDILNEIKYRYADNLGNGYMTFITNSGYTYTFAYGKISNEPMTRAVTYIKDHSPSTFMELNDQVSPHTKLCRYCKTEIPKDAIVCPQCRKKQNHGCLTAFLMVIAIVTISTYMAKNEQKDDPTLKESTVSSVQEKQTSAEKTVTKETESNIPREYKSALNQADTYANMMHMSKDAIYNQLTSEFGGQFTEDAARYAVNHVDTDWNENALASAQTYSDSMHMSKARIFDQLTSEYGGKFTDDEAQYAVDNVNADWNENALLTAENYQESMSLSLAAIKDQLMSEYGEKFTESQAQYAIDHLR